MNNDIIDTIMVDDDTRILVSYDDMPDNPLEWGVSSIEAMPLSISSRLDDSEYSMNNEDMLTIVDGVDMVGGDIDDLVKALDKHYDRRGWSHYVAHYAGPSQGDWVDMYIATDSNEYCEAESFANDEFEKYWDGEVYTLVLERRHTWHDDKGETLYTWDMVDNLSGVYGDSTEDIKAAAADYFFGVSFDTVKDGHAWRY